MKKTALLIMCMVLLFACFGCMAAPDLPGSSEVPTQSADASPTPADATPSPSPFASPDPSDTPTPSDDPIAQDIAMVKALIEQNGDCIGYLRIDGTKLSYPVVFTPSDPEHYLRLDLNQKHSTAGTIFLDGGSSVEPRSTSWLLHGHNMRDGSMFATLLGYKKKSFYQEHPQITFITESAVETYEIFAIFNTEVKEKDDPSFKYYQFHNAKTKAEFDSAIKNMKAMNEFTIDVTPEFGDELLLLSTCDRNYDYDHGRFVVAARKISSEGVSQ